MLKNVHGVLLGISVLPALLVMPAMADGVYNLVERVEVNAGDDFTYATANVSSSSSFSGAAVFNTFGALSVLGAASFSDNSVAYDSGLSGEGSGLINGNGGAISNSEGNITLNGGATFLRNTANDGMGGAVFTRNWNQSKSGLFKVVGNSLFEYNSAIKGGALALNSSSAQFVGNVDFNHNGSTSTEGGGAIYSYGDVTIVGDRTGFSENTAQTGGAVSLIWGGDNQISWNGTTPNAAVLNISGKAIFKKNKATGTTSSSGMGGAVYMAPYAQLNISDSDEVLFDKNESVGAGGAIYNLGLVDIDATSIKFTDNKASSGAAISANGSTRPLTVLHGGDILFQNNQSASSYGGAIFNLGDMQILGAKNEFRLNKAKAYVEGNIKNGGGAIQNRGYNKGGDTVLLIGKNDLSSENTFYKNSSYQHGGAIYARAVDGTSNNSVVTIQGATNSFEQNSADVHGGAIGNYVEYKESSSVFTIGTANFTINGETSFVGNTAGTDEIVGNGGAIFNNGTFVLNGQSIFCGNTATGVGGAIDVDYASVGSKYTYGSVALNGNTEFSGNSATKGGAVWTNTGANFTISDAESVMFSGNSATVETGGAIWNAGITSITATNIDFIGNTSVLGGGAVYNTGTFNIDGNASFTNNVAGGVANDIYNNGIFNIVSGTTTVAGGINGTGTLNIGSDAILNIGTTMLTQNTVDIANTGRLVALLNTPESFAKLNVNNFSGTGTLALVLKNPGTYNLFQGDDTVSEHYIEFSDTGITLDSPVYNIVWSDDGKSVTASRKTMDQVADSNNLSVETGQMVLNLMDSSSAKLNDLALMVQEQLALNNSEVAEHMHAAINPETTSVMQSASVAMQNTVAGMASGRMGAIGKGRNGGDVMLTSGGIWAQGVYNKSKQNDSFNGYTRGIAFGLDGTVNNIWTLGIGYAYAHSDVSATARDTDIDSLTIFAYGQYKPADWYVNTIVNYTMSDYSEQGDVLGIAVKSDYNVRSLGAQVMTGYDFAGGITPQVGLRYAHVSADDYKNSLDIANSFSDLNYLTAVLETKYANRFDVSKRLALCPEFHYGVMFDLVSDNQVAQVTIPGINSYTIYGDQLSRLGAEFGLGIGAKYRDMDLSLNYDIEVREGYSSQTGRVKFRYNF